MALDSGLVVGYLTVAVQGAGRAAADRRTDSLLDHLNASVLRSVGRGPIDRLRQNPDDEAIRNEVGLTIDGAAARDGGFVQELEAIVAELDERGGRNLINQAYAQPADPAYAQPTPSAAGHAGPDGRGSRTHPLLWFHMATAPLWSKVLIVVGFVVFMGGAVMFGYSIFTSLGDVDQLADGELPTAFRYFGIPVAGILLIIIGNLGAAFSRRS